MTMRQALISVSDKTGVVELAKALHAKGIRIISSGGTAKELAANGILCTEVSAVTGFPEILGGRVKTLQPQIHGGILARRDMPAHLEELKKHSIEPIDIVVVNLYPFEETISGHDDKIITGDIIENIDIGGVALLRASAKNFTDVLVVCDPADYAPLVEKLNSGAPDISFRRELAAKAFRHTAYYDALISNYFTLQKFPEQLTLPLKKLSGLRYGENPHQEAAAYINSSSHRREGAARARQLQGKELSYNNYLDLESAWQLVGEFEKPACGIIKHSNPCGCAEGASILEAYRNALACDRASAFGGIIAFNRAVDEETAKEVVGLFTECIIAPEYSPEALAVFAAKKNLRILLQPELPRKAATPEIDYRSLTGAMLVQDRDAALLTETKTAGKRAPDAAEAASLLFAWKVCKHVKSNAIILVRGTQTVGIGAGQMSRIDSVKIASEKMKEVAIDPSVAAMPLVLASDAFFPFPDVVNAAAAIGVKAIIQPGGSLRDADSIAAADSHNIAMLMTAMRHFRH
ncbi:MAG: bifunctional phosphoribosylaminoimidazolecarboxamide formyltransferase/IMP cyclohydrolase [Elusimicrobia bacterium RIFOXYA2_FULL_50_26]|nr:MAG: bifunctional phosphoribosylaminoimidazolecarboxamide formyltransferase/IMP cyclohydrolase [Elusimicrobia bacterium RIFOXYA2_FULL_50_26]